MDWLLDPRHPGAPEAAASAVADHLARHADEHADARGADEEVAKAVAALPEGEQTVWLHLDWTASRPRLTLRPVDVAPDAFPAPTDDAPEGLRPVSGAHRAKLDEGAGTALASLDLDVPRRVGLQFDPEVGVLAGLDIDPERDGAAAVAVALAAAVEAHPVGSPEQVASVAGAVLSDASLDHEPADLREVTDAFVRAHAALGGTPTVVSRSEDRAELVIERCPFGSNVDHAPSLCRVTQTMAGRLASRVQGEATVVLDETIAQGDPACRLQVMLGPAPDDVAGNTYHWPPAGTAAFDDDPAPRLELTVSLPRESHSVPVVRRLAAQALRAFGVTDEDISDVELAITEACANVVDHAVESDSYEVDIELAADRCALTVIDRGGGFDATVVQDQEDDDAEHGRGISLMRALVDNVNFANEPQVGAVVHMVKELTYDSSHPLHSASKG